MSTTTRTPVVVGVDGSTSAGQAVRWAADEAVRRQVPLRLVHALDFAAYAHAGGFGAPQGFYGTFAAAGRRMLDEVRAAVLRDHPDLVVDCEARTADVTAALVDQSGDACMVVLGSRGLGGFSGVLVGSTAVALTAHAHCPVAIVRGRTPEADPPVSGPVVVGVDGTPAGEPALATAFDEAYARGAELVAVHTWTQFSAVSPDTYAHQFTLDWEAMENREREVLAAEVSGWQEKYPEVAVRQVVSRDRPVRGLLEHSAGARLLVVGSRGHGGLPGMLHGSTSQSLIHHATCPLLVVHTADPR